MPPDATLSLPRFLARQALLDAAYRVAGYEFGMRDRVLVEVLPGAEDPEQARDEHLIAAVVDLEARQALAGRLVVLDLSPASLANAMLAQLPADKVALALPTTLPDLAGAAAALSGLGLSVMLDDDGAALPAALPPGCVLARLDSGRHDALALGERVGQLRRLGVTRLVAGNVGSEEAFEVCRKLGFDLYQGDFLTQPRPGGARKLDSGVMQVMELLNLAQEKASVERMEAVFKRDAALTYRLLRYINSPANGLGRAIQSIGHALVWLGYDPLYRWLSLLLFSTGRGDGRDDALLRNALARARFMENLGARQFDATRRGGLFIVGILSHLDALLNLPMNQALEPLRLPDAMRAALIEGDGPYAPYLLLARACERFDQDAVAALADQHGFVADEVNLAHVDALIWAEELDR
jgi:EAL and modified HD-GYP domain-containing signal transduction protein